MLMAHSHHVAGNNRPMENPYKPPESEPPETEETDPDWIYRECFALGILALAFFYALDTILRVVQGLRK